MKLKPKGNIGGNFKKGKRKTNKGGADFGKATEYWFVYNKLNNINQ